MLKATLIGSARSGKTSIALRMVCDAFNEDYNPSSGSGYFGTSRHAERQGVLLRLFDTAGDDWRSDGFQSLPSTTPVWNSDVVMVVYDVTDADSTVPLRRIIAQLRAKRSDVPIILVGNKADDPNRTVPTEEGQRLAEELDIFFVEMSAKTGSGIDQLEHIALDIFSDPSFTPKTSLLPDMVLTMSACRVTTGEVPISCINMAGNVMATLYLTHQVTLGCILLMLTQQIGLPRTRLKMILPNGKLMQSQADVSSLIDPSDGVVEN